MVAFRKAVPVLALFALLLGAQSLFAQVQPAPIQCVVTAGVPPVVRAEGFTELVGDIVITCTGGSAINPFLANFQVFLNTNITSRLTTSDLSEALLLIDEPTAATFCPSPAAASNGATVAAAGGTTSIVVGPNGQPLPLVPGGTAPTCNAFAAGSLTQTGTYNAFRGQRTVGGAQQESALTWSNIPVVPPGTTQTRVFRITNIRADATKISSGIGLPGQIVAFVSIFPPGTLPLNNPQQIVGYTQPGLAFDLRNATNTGDPSINIDQCVSNSSAQRDLFADPNDNVEVPGFNSFRFREGFQSSFKPRIVTGQNGANAGTVFNSESGYVRAVGASTVGLADTGTRLAVRFTNVPANLRIFVTNRNANVSGTDPSLVVGRALLVTTDQAGAFGSSPTDQFGGVSPDTFAPLADPNSVTGPTLEDTSFRLVEVPIVNGTGLAVWEVVDNGNNTSLTGVNEELYFPYAIAYRYQAQVGTGLPQVGLGTGQVVGSFAPFYASAGSMSQTLPIPRFITPSSAPINAINVRNCQTNLLFPYVTNWQGFDTGIAISNTSEDQPGFPASPVTGPFSDPQNRRQAGRCRLYYFGRLQNGNAPTSVRQETDRDVAAGETITMVLSTGGSLGLAGNPNFQGYILAQCDFRFAHGFAFITDGPIGQARVAEGYLALVLDGGSDTSMRLRGQATGENRAH